MIQSSVELYEALTSAPDDKTRAKLIAEAFERLDERYPRLKDVATGADLRETELRLLKEIEQVRKEIEQVRADLRVEIEQQRTELKGDIERLRTELKGDIERLRTELKTDIEHLRSELKGDIERLRTELKTDIEHLRSELKTDIEHVRGDIARTKLDLLKWLLPLMLAQVAAIAALVKLL